MTAKLEISLPEKQVAHIKDAISSGRSESVSGYISSELERAQHEHCLTDLLDDLDAEFGKPSRSDDAWAREKLEM